MTDFEHATTDAAVEIYETTFGLFSALLSEIRELSKKKPDATLSSSKVKLVNTVLSDLLEFLNLEPQGKYLALLESEDLPQVSDALMMMVQFDASLKAFRERYYQYLAGIGFRGKHYWVTVEAVKIWEEEESESDALDEED